MTVNERGAGMRLTKYDFLHPCRHCGGENFRVVSVAGDEPDVAIVCERCHWTVPSRKDAIIGSETRPSPSWTDYHEYVRQRMQKGRP